MEIDKVFNNDVDGVADNLFSAVKNSVSEIKAMQQRKAAENVQLVIRALKKLETELRETNEDVANQLALRIASIKDGRDGKDGKNGKDGRDGKTGLNGKDGNKGDKGSDGRDGVDGVDGVSVVNANIDFDGSLVITLSDGREINVGEVVAPDLAERIKVISTMSTNGAVGIKDEGTSISTGVKTINFVGATVTATNSGDDVTVNVSAGTGTVTSVAATVPAFLSVTGSPVTTSGTLAIGLSGTALPVANGGTGITALGTGVATALGVNTGASGAFVVNGGALGTPSSGTVTNLTGTASININGTVGATTPAAGTFTSVSDSGNLTFTGTGNRITGDMSNATAASRMAFQTSTTNGNSFVNVIPNGTGTSGGFIVYSTPDLSNAAFFTHQIVGGSDARFNSSITGTGTYLPMTFYTGGSESLRLSATTKAVILSGGSTSADGTGITFPATQSASSDVNTLDDYEEGTWTPTLSFSTNGNLSVTYTTQVGSYTKIGNTVRLAFNIVTSAFTHTTASGNAQIATLPFSGANVTGLRQYGSIQLSGVTKANYTQASPYVEVNDATIRIQAWGSGQAVSNIVAADMPTGTTIWLRGIIVYQTAT
jgi:hypothetical protein